MRLERGDAAGREAIDKKLSVFSKGAEGRCILQ